MADRWHPQMEGLFDCVVGQNKSKNKNERGEEGRKMEKIITWLIKKLVTIYWKKYQFYALSWGVDEIVTLRVMSEESYLDRHRIGVREEKYK